MHYLEDCLEMMEHLPQELRGKFTDMKELDLQVLNSMDTMEKRVNVFFSAAAKMTPNEKKAEFESIKKDYYKNVADSDVKVQLASQMCDIVGRYLKRVDQEMYKFKMELEADHKGITEILEKRSLEMDTPSTHSSQKENRYIPKQREKRRCHNKRIVVSAQDRVVPQFQANLNNLPISLGQHIGAGGTTIAAAASQMQQERRTASLNASGGAAGPTSQEISTNEELAGAESGTAAIQNDHEKISTLVPGTGTPLIAYPASFPSPQEPLPAQSLDKEYDPYEPRYCFCNDVAFGMMVACDSKSCPYEWFHYPCVGIVEKPKGKWYCPHCMSVLKKKQN